MTVWTMVPERELAAQGNSRVEINSRSGEDQNARPSAPRSLCESWSFAYIEKTGLSCLLFTSDAMLLKVMRTGFSAAIVDLELRTDAASAIELSSRRHLDGFVIDCDDASGARDVLTKIRSSRSNQLSVIFAVVNATTTIASKAMANFVLTKPVPHTQLSGFLDIAVARMEREHRRYFRHEANVPLQLFCNTGWSFAGKIKNVSEVRTCPRSFWAHSSRGSGNSAIRASQCAATNFPSRGGGGLERRLCYGFTLSPYRARLSFRF